MPKPVGRNSRSPSPPRGGSGGSSGSGGQPNPKGKAKAKASAGTRLQKLWCAAFLKGNCTKGDGCAFPHISGEAVAGIKAALDVQRKKDNSKGAAPAQEQDKKEGQ